MLLSRCIARTRGARKFEVPRRHFRGSAASRQAPPALLAPLVPLVPLVFLATSDSGADSEAPGSGDVVEPRTGLRVPGCLNGDQVVVGVGARSVICGNYLVYMLALYQKGSVFRDLLNKYSTPEGVLDAIVENPADTTIRIVLYRSTGRDHFLESICRRVKDRLNAQEPSRCEGGQAQESVERFRSLFRMPSLAKGTHVDLAFEQDRFGQVKLDVYVNDSLKGSILDRNFQIAIIDVFIGARANSQEIRQAILRDISGKFQ